MIISLILFITVHGTHLLRWMRKKDYLSFGSIKHFSANKKKQIHPTEITVANPHTQSPKLNIRKANNGTGVAMNSAFSVSGKWAFEHEHANECNAKCSLHVKSIVACQQREREKKTHQTNVNKLLLCFPLVQYCLGMEGSTVHTVSTPVSNRYPAEDSTLEYTYDNAGLQVTPVGDKPKSETTFWIDSIGTWMRMDEEAHTHTHYLQM